MKCFSFKKKFSVPNAEEKCMMISPNPPLYSLEQENYVKYGDVLKYNEFHITITLTYIQQITKRLSKSMRLSHSSLFA